MGVDFNCGSLPSIEDRIGAMGFGPAQVLYLVIGGILTFTRSCQMLTMSQLTTPAQKRLHLSHTEAGFLSSILFLGMVIGTLLSGYLGDRFGRRLPIRVGGVLVPVLGCVSALPLRYTFLLFIRFCLGFFLSFGDVPLNALLNELTPTKWQIAMRSTNEIFYDLGFGFAAALAAHQDPSLRDINFSSLTLMATIPPGILAITTIFLLPESPVFLAARGRMEEAKAVLADMKYLNRASNQDISFARPPQKERPTSGMEGFRLIFGPRYWLLTFTLAFSTLMIKLFYYGGIYSQPLVLTKSHGLQPGWEIALGGPFQIFGAVFSSLVVRYFAPQSVMVFSMFMAAKGIFWFGFAGTIVSNSFLMHGMYHFGCTSFYWVEALAIIILSQLAVGMYPTSVASTSGSVACAAGRIGCIIAPVLFEWVRTITGQWNIFCYMTAAGCLGSSALFALTWRPVEEDGDSDPTLPLIAPNHDTAKFETAHESNAMAHKPDCEKGFAKLTKLLRAGSIE